MTFRCTMFGGLTAAALVAGPALAGGYATSSSQPKVAAPARASQSGRTPRSGSAIQPYAARAIQPASSRQAAVYQNQGVQTYASHQVQPYSSQAVKPYSSQAVKPYTAQQVQPYASHAMTPFSARPVEPYSSHEVKPYVAHEVQPYSSHPVRLATGRGGYLRPRGGGASVSSLLGVWGTRVGAATWTGPSDQWGYATQHTSAGAMSGALAIRPDHTFVWRSSGCPHSAGWTETGDPGKPIALRCIDGGEQKLWYVEPDDRHPGQIYVFDQWGVYYVGRR